MSNQLKDILRAKLRRGAGLGAGELSLVITDLISLYDEMETKIETLNEKFDALSGGGDRGSKKSTNTSKVQHNKER